MEYLNCIKGMNVAATAFTKDQAADLLKQDEFDVIIIGIDLSQDRFEGINTVTEINRMAKSKIIVLTPVFDEEITLKLFYSGAVNFVLKADYKEIPSVIRSSINSAFPLELFWKDYMRMKREEQLRALTPAERQIFELMEKGYNKSQIRKMLCKSESTIKNQVNKLLKKLEVSNYNEALAKVGTEPEK